MIAKKRIIATAVASLVLGGAGVRLAFAESAMPDVRQEDRQMDRRQDRQAEQQMENEMEVHGVEVKIALPRTGAGAVDTTALLADVQTQIASGAREIQFRGAKAGDLQGLVLSADSMQSVLAQIGALLPSDGIGRSVTVRGADGSRVRVQRADNGTLRARIDNVGGLTADQVAQIRQQLAALGFTRVRVDARGGNSGSGRSMSGNAGSGRGSELAQANDVRREDRRADRAAEHAAGDVRQEDRAAEHAAGDVRREDRSPEASRHGDRVARVDRPDRMDRPDKVDRPDRMDRPDKVDRPDRSGRH